MSQPEYAQAWLSQWRRAAVALAEVRRHELATMSDAAALAATERVLAQGAPPRLPHGERRSGLVEQQRIFQRSR